MDAAQRVFVSNVEASAIGVSTTDGYQVVVQDDRLSWPDGFAFGPDGNLYVTQNSLYLHPAFNRGTEAGQLPYRLLRVPPAALAEALVAAGLADGQE